MTKHLQKLFALVLVCCAFLGSSSNATGQVLKEHFNYAAGSALTANGWVAHSAAGTNAITVTPEGTSLVYRDYAGSGAGNAVTLKTTGEDVHKTFTAFTSGSVYVGFLMNVSAASPAGDYFLHLGPNTISTTFLGRVSARSSGEGFQLGVSKGTTPAPVYGNDVYELNKTYLVVMKYTIVAGASNDNVELFVNPVMKNSEPSTATITATVGGTDPANIGSVALRQGSATAAPEVTIDGIVITNSWDELRGITPLLVENFSYAPNSKITDSGNWTAHSGAGTNAITTTTEGSSLVYNNYAASGVGEAVTLKTSGEDVNRSFEMINEGQLYTSFLMSATTAAAAGDYFFHLGPAEMGNAYIGRVFVKSSGTGFQLGISKGSSPAAVYGSTVYEFGKTYLVVMKYKFNTGTTTDDIIELFVNPTLGAGEPATATVTAATGGTDAINLGTVALRQGSASNAANVIVDGIVVGTEWEALLGVADETAPTIASLTPANGTENLKTTTNNISIIFSENIVKGSGNIVLVDAANAANNQTINVTSSTVQVSGATVTIPVTLAANTNYYVQIPATAFTDRAGNAFAGITDNTTWAFSTPEFATPVLTANVTSVSVPYSALGTPTRVTSYILSGVDVIQPVAVTSTGSYQVSLDGTTFSTTVAVPAADVIAGKTVYVRLNATEVNDYAGTIRHETPGSDLLSVNVAGGVYNPYAQDFNNCTPAFSKTLTGGWKQFSLEGDVTWACTSFGRPAEGTTTNTGAVDINGYSSAVGHGVANSDWLISPSIDLTAKNIPLLSFYTKSAFLGPELKLMISTTYDGTSVPSLADWTELNVEFAEVGSDTWTRSEVLLDAYKQGNVHIAFVYTSLYQVDGSSRWTVDDFLITDETSKLVTSNTSFDFGAVPAGQSSTAMTFTLKALGYTNDIVVTAPANFEVSKDNITFSESVSYTVAEAAEENTVYVRFTPATTQLAFEGRLEFTSGTDLSMTGGKLRGSSIPKSTTLDIVTWNVEWFGADVDGDGKILGPSNDELQFTNVKQAILAMDADIYALQEIANDEAMERLVNELPGYAFVKSDTYSYSVREANFIVIPQKLYLVYRTSTVAVKNQKVLLKALYSDILANRVVLEGYNPTASGTDQIKDDAFWSSGRLPHMVELEANIGGNIQRLHVVNLHARANSGTDITRYNMREYDLKVLKDSLDHYYPNVNLIMLGDYNDDVDVSVVGTGKASTYKPFVDDPNYNVLTYDLSLTGVGTYKASSFLDHIAVSKSLNDEYITNSIRIEDGLVNLIPRYFTTTSDHLPVSARFDFSNTPVVTFTTASITKKEGTEAFEVNLTLSAAQAKDHTVVIGIKEGATASSDDYTTNPAVDNGKITVTIPANATSATFGVSIVDDNETEETEHVQFYISQVSTDLGIGATARTFNLTIQDNSPTNVRGDVTKGLFKLYPNPTQGYVNITLPEHVASLSNINLTVVSIEGRKVFSATGTQDKVQQLLNDKVAGMAKGLYIIKVEAGKDVYQAKLLKN